MFKYISSDRKWFLSCGIVAAGEIQVPVLIYQQWLAPNRRYLHNEGMEEW